MRYSQNTMFSCCVHIRECSIEKANKLLASGEFSFSKRLRKPPGSSGSGSR